MSFYIRGEYIGSLSHVRFLNQLKFSAKMVPGSVSTWEMVGTCWYLITQVPGVLTSLGPDIYKSIKQAWLSMTCRCPQWIPNLDVSLGPSNGVWSRKHPVNLGYNFASTRLLLRAEHSGAGRAITGIVAELVPMFDGLERQFGKLGNF